LGKRRDSGCAWDSEPCAEVVAKIDAELGAGLGEGEEGVATVATDIAAGAAADFASGDVAADVILRSVGVQRNLWSVEYHQQFGLVGMKPREQTVEGDEAGLAREDAIETEPAVRPCAVCWERNDKP
jgi:hypothetical protein